MKCFAAKNFVTVRRCFSLGCFSLAAVLWFSVSLTQAADFEKPVRMKAAGKVVAVESPGYAAPCWADIDGDGKKDLLVGQFNDGKIRAYKNLGNNKLAAGKWIEADKKTAIIPGIF